MTENLQPEALRIVGEAMKKSGIQTGKYADAKTSDAFLLAIDEAVAEKVAKEKNINGSLKNALNREVLKLVAVPAEKIYQLPPEKPLPYEAFFNSGWQGVKGVFSENNAHAKPAAATTDVICTTTSHMALDPALSLSHGLQELSCRKKPAALPGM